MHQVHAAPAIAPRGISAAVLSDRLTGLAVIAGLPTVLWTFVIYVGAWALDAQLSTAGTLGVAAAIFLFLVCIWAAFALADRANSADE